MTNSDEVQRKVEISSNWSIDWLDLLFYNERDFVHKKDQRKIRVVTLVAVIDRRRRRNLVCSSSSYAIKILKATDRQNARNNTRYIRMFCRDAIIPPSYVWSWLMTGPWVLTSYCWVVKSVSFLLLLLIRVEGGVWVDGWKIWLT